MYSLHFNKCIKYKRVCFGFIWIDHFGFINTPIHLSVSEYIIFLLHSSLTNMNNFSHNIITSIQMLTFNLTWFKETLSNLVKLTKEVVFKNNHLIRYIGQGMEKSSSKRFVSFVTVM